MSRKVVVDIDTPTPVEFGVKLGQVHSSLCHCLLSAPPAVLTLGSARFNKLQTVFPYADIRAYIACDHHLLPEELHGPCVVIVGLLCAQKTPRMVLISNLIT
jgi:hypothetical protein